MKSINEKLFSEDKITNLESIIGGVTYTCNGDNCDVHNGDQGSTWCDDVTDTDCDKDYAINGGGGSSGIGTSQLYPTTR